MIEPARPGEIRLREDALEWREVEGEIVALDLPAREYLAINRTGAAIWPLLASGATREELVGRLVSEFGIGHASATRDAGDFVSQLQDRDLVEGG